MEDYDKPLRSRTMSVESSSNAAATATTTTTGAQPQTVASPAQNQ